MNRLNRAGVGFVSVTQNFSTTDAVGRMTLNLLATFAEFEREQIGERTRDKMAASRRRGKWTGGVVPLGYRVIDKKLVIDNHEAELVRELFGLYLEQRSALTVAQTLTDRGRTTGRYLANSGRVREARAWGKGDVLSVLKKPLYIGLMRYRDELHDGEHEAIIDLRTFELARTLLARTNGGRTPRRRNPDYLLSGILMCARCGSALTAASSRKGGRAYRYYRCTKRDREGRAACPTRPMSASAIEEYVAQRLREAIANSDLAASATSVTVRIETRRRDLTVERHRLSSEIATLSTDLNDTNIRLQERERRLAEVEGEIAMLDATKLEACWIAQCLRDFNSVWDVLTSQNRGRLFRAVVERVDVDDEGGEVRITLANLGGDATEEKSA